MKKLIRGITEFHESRKIDYVEAFEKLALGQKPDALFIACSDSRVAANVFASTDPGDLFVHRNVGNLVLPSERPEGMCTAAAVDFAVENLKVRNIIICGHSDCGAVNACCKGLSSIPPGPLRTWLEMGTAGLELQPDPNSTSRRNVLAQLEHLKTYPSVNRAIVERGLGLHGLWFDIRHLDVLFYEEAAGQWTLLDTENGKRILGQLEGKL